MPRDQAPDPNLCCLDFKGCMTSASSLLFLHVRLCDCEREKGEGIKKGKVGGVRRTLCGDSTVLSCAL